ncbi:MAG TPA: DUF6152 family protein [Gammaproteobacteria bacterium]
MKSTRFRSGLGIVAVVSLAWVALPGATFAHHSFAAEFDRNKPVDVTGTVTKVEWTNPHARFYVDAVDEDGNKVNWDFELTSPNVLMRRGWKRDSLQVGDEVSVHGFRAKNAEHVANAASVILADGTKVFTGSAGEAER